MPLVGAERASLRAGRVLGGPQREGFHGASEGLRLGPKLRKFSHFWQFGDEVGSLLHCPVTLLHTKLHFLLVSLKGNDNGLGRNLLLLQVVLDFNLPPMFIYCALKARSNTD